LLPTDSVILNYAVALLGVAGVWAKRRSVGVNIFVKKYYILSPGNVERKLKWRVSTNLKAF
jgi:hypothetical protein